MVPFFFYTHDHLYSPAALVHTNGTVLERYEYDAYGNPYILDAQYAPRTTSNYGNPYLFTGRRADYLDSGSLKIQYNRNRYYDYYSGRWLTHDPLGYVDGMNLYEYVKSNPVINKDPMGLSAIVKRIAITRLKKLDDKHAGYDYYTELTGLKSLIFDKLVPALEWVPDDRYFWVTTPVSYEAQYIPIPRCIFNMTPSVDGEVMFHESIHVYNDKNPFGFGMSLREDEGIAWAARRMEGHYWWFQDIEKLLSEDTPNVGKLGERWRNMWFSINRGIVGFPVSEPISFIIQPWDVTKVLRYLDFELSCKKIAKHYNSILKTKSNWKKEHCPQFTCTTVPLVNIKSLHLNQKLLSVFE